MGDPADHFDRVAGDYATFRPRYPDALFRWLADNAPGRRLAWDAGTGNGQAAVALAGYFDRVLATDAGAEQIRKAVPHRGIEYRQAQAESSGLADHSADLVTVAQALHWFDTAAFFREVARVLVPGGVVAAWSYGNVQLDHPDLQHLVSRFYYEEIGPWWPPNRALVEDGYKSIPFPFHRLEAPPFEMKVEWSLPQFLGYVGTWSAVTLCREATGRDPVAGLAAELEGPWGNGASRRPVRWPLTVLAGRST